MASRSPSALNKEAGGSGANEASSLLADILAAIKELETTPETWDQKVHVDVAERLCAAAVAGDTGVVRAVLKNHPLAVKCQNAGGLTALHLAAMHGHADTAAYLLNFHADVNALDNRGFTPLDHCPTDPGKLGKRRPHPDDHAKTHTQKTPGNDYEPGLPKQTSKVNTQRSHACPPKPTQYVLALKEPIRRRSPGDSKIPDSQANYISENTRE
ncbi:6-phosphofructo-2-kinase/fructose-2 [Diplonema papillatum]|nr:6-phosphofructo-2-kinase/fructose-2 [Diplonema papillatum]